jgi:hypothetical protein
VAKNNIDKGPCLPEHIFSVDETGLLYQNMPSHTYISEEEKNYAWT